MYLSYSIIIYVLEFWIHFLIYEIKMSTIVFIFVLNESLYCMKRNTAREVDIDQNLDNIMESQVAKSKDDEKKKLL